MQSQDDMFYGFWFQYELRSLYREPPVIQLAERRQLRPNDLAYIGALPIPHNQKIMHVCQSANPSRKRGVEIFKILGTPGDLTRNALHNREQVLRAMGQLQHDGFDMPLVALVRCHVGAESKAWNRDADHECEQQK